MITSSTITTKAAPGTQMTTTLTISRHTIPIFATGATLIKTTITAMAIISMATTTTTATTIALPIVHDYEESVRLRETVARLLRVMIDVSVHTHSC